MPQPTIEKGFRLSKFPLIRPLLVRNFAWLWGGSILSYLGGQLTLIAFPWLVLQISGDPLAMGAVLAVGSIPRAVFMLVGGVFSDRYSPLTVMLWVNWLRMFLMFAFAWLVFSQNIDMWMVYVLALMFGVIDAFYWPASSAILPRILEMDDLPAGNSLMQGLGQLTLMAGPVIAGFVIAAFSDASAGEAADLPGIAVVFFIDGIGFIFAIAALSMIRLAPLAGSEAGSADAGTLIGSFVDGLVAAWRDVPVRIMIIVFTVFSLFFRGPWIVGIPLMADARFPEGALAFGMISSAFGVGSLIGLIAAGTLPRPGLRWFGYLIGIDLLAMGLGMFVYAYASTVELTMVAAAIGGIADGYMVIILVAWLQSHIPAERMGRVMSLMMFFMQGVAPISAAVAGALLRISIEGVFAGAGAAMIAFVVICLLFPSFRNMEKTLAS